VDLVVDEVQQLEDVHVADGHLVVEALAGAAVVEPHLARAAPPRRLLLVDLELHGAVGPLLGRADEEVVDLGQGRAVEHR
jgi:hypothetical protein